MTKRKISTRKRKYNLDKKVALEIHARIFDENSRITIAEVFPQAVALALRAKHGIINSERLTDAQVAEMADIMLPLCDAIDAAATAGAARVFTEFHTDPIWRDYFRTRSAAMLGQKGGRPNGGRSKHLRWLDDAVKKIDRDHAERILPRTPLEFFEELQKLPDIEGSNDDGSLAFDMVNIDKSHDVGDDTWPSLSLNAIRKAVTRLRAK